MDVEQLDLWFPKPRQQEWVAQLSEHLGMTRVRAEYFLRLWIFAAVAYEQSQNPGVKPPLAELTVPPTAIICTHGDAAALFYSDKTQGSDRAAGMMLDKLAALGLITKTFDGNTSAIAINPLPTLVNCAEATPTVLVPDAFDPRCDAVPIANLLATNYNWMNHSTEVVPHRIARLLRRWAHQYGVGMRVLRQPETLHPVGFYLLYPTASASEAAFFQPPSKALHLSTMKETDPFQMATAGDPDCVAIFIRSWMIDAQYQAAYQVPFLQDSQRTIRRIMQDFPNLCDLHTLLIHPRYEQLADLLGFQILPLLR